MTDMRLDDDPLSPNYGDVIYDNTGATVTVNQADSVAQRLRILSDLFPRSKGRDFGKKFIVLDIHDKYVVRDFLNLRCVDCSTEVYKRPNSIFSGVIPCKCSKSYRHSSEHYVSILKDKGFDILSNKINLRHDSCVELQCSRCCKIGEYNLGIAIYSNICCLSQRYQRNRDETISDIRINIKESNSTLVLDTVPANPKIDDYAKVICNCCNEVKEFQIRNLIHSRISCRCFAKYGFKSLSLAYLYLLKIRTKSGETFGKLGITGNISRRVSELKRNNTSVDEIEILEVYVFKKGLDATRLEKSLLRKFCNTYKHPLEDGKRETFHLNVLEQIREDSLKFFMEVSNE